MGSNEFKKQPYLYGFKDDINPDFKTRPGLDKEIIEQISNKVNEPEWMLEYRLQAYQAFLELENPTWGVDLSFINFDDYIYYAGFGDEIKRSWNDVPKKIKDTFKALNIQEAEAKFLNGVHTQYDSSVVYSSLMEELEQKGVIFTDIHTAVREHPELIKKYFGQLVPFNNNKYAALNSAVFAGGTFIYVPKNTQIDLPLQSYFRINSQSLGQFERTLIIVDEDSSLHYIEGCTAPIYQKDNLHAAVVEIFVHKNSKCRYTTIQNWSDNVLNLVTKRAYVYENANMTWIDGNIGSRINMKYPASILAEPYASSECISIAVAKSNVIQDAGAKMIHNAPYTRSKIISKAVGYGTGDSRYRGLVKIGPQAHNSVAKVECDTLLLNETARSDTFPLEIVQNNSSYLNHEATITKISAEQLFYLQTKGFSIEIAEQLIVFGFLKEFSDELPMEYAAELNRLLKLDMTGAIG
ncbi:Fe-S cluster assembly protein SufB [Ureaplasma miroungigenitalium]|uniref:Fe-S cluster assembly protein SufB n=1 Tax=Ureaplasma miroungigenitalium TaxID=1042321 RepID=A0ABT3BMV8_9BACT|nr:Fe-S cluster assembly protein SufB [Ureaplasma miroungigenitalium]MCV3728561.1 Fe-S cluster assembly protein SufB [Ureaplasma miroungigenitalium]